MVASVPLKLDSVCVVSVGTEPRTKEHSVSLEPTARRLWGIERKDEWTIKHF